MQHPGSSVRSSWRSAPSMKQRRLALARFIKGRREFLEIDLKDAAAQVGASRWSYAEWETGARSIKAEILPALVKLLKAAVRMLAATVRDADPTRIAGRPKRPGAGSAGSRSSSGPSRVR